MKKVLILLTVFMSNLTYGMSGSTEDMEVVEYSESEWEAAKELLDIGMARKEDEVNDRSLNNLYSYVCKKCKGSFATRSDLNEHNRVHNKCDVEGCGATSIDKFGLKMHKRTHTGERPHKCDECKATFAQRYTLDQHIRTHTRERPYECNECEVDFSRSDALRKHMRTKKHQDKIKWNQDRRTE